MCCRRFFLSQEPSDIQHLYAQVADFTDVLASEYRVTFLSNSKNYSNNQVT